MGVGQAERMKNRPPQDDTYRLLDAAGVQTVEQIAESDTGAAGSGRGQGHGRTDDLAKETRLVVDHDVNCQLVAVSLGGQTVGVGGGAGDGGEAAMPVPEL